MKRRTKLQLGLGILLAAMLAPAAAASDAPPRQSAKARRALEERVRRELVRLPYYSVFDNLEYRVDGYRVTLSGQTIRPSVRRDAEKVVERLEGVEGVVNNIEVLPVSIHDDRIRLATYRAIYSSAPLQRYALSPVPSIHIIVKRGHITLIGVVDNESDGNIAYLQARTVPFSFSVTNNLRVVK